MSRPDFQKTWASSRVSIPEITDPNYALGFAAYLGAQPPTTDDHDYIMNLQDSRAIWLAGIIDSVRIDIASAATVDLDTLAPDTRNIRLTGTTTITGFTVSAGATYLVSFSGAMTLTNSAGLVTQTGANIKTAAGDTCIIRATAANTVEVMVYKKAIAENFGFQVFTSSGSFVVPDNVFKIKYKLWGGGGGGGGVGSTGAGGAGGGGGGGSSEGVLDVVPGQTITVTIGAAGTAGGAGGSGGTGGTTTLVRSAVTLAAATGGAGGAPNGSGGAGGAAGAGTVGTLQLSGGQGGTTSGSVNGIGGLGADSTGSCVQGAGFGQGGPGKIPGGGGAGTGSQLAAGGGAGARGQVNFEW